MNKKVIATISVVLLVGLLGGFLLLRAKGTAKTSNNTTVTQDSSPKSLKDLLISGIAQKCTFSSDTESVSSEGVTYIASGKVRGDFSITKDSKTTKSHMIVDGKIAYIWTDGQTNGFKTTIPDESTATPSSQTNTPVSGYVSSFDQKSDYKCEAWRVDQSLFTLPVGITFKDMSALIPTMAPKTKGGSNSSQCSYCNNLTGDSKTQCLAELKCN